MGSVSVILLDTALTQMGLRSTGRVLGAAFSCLPLSFFPILFLLNHSESFTPKNVLHLVWIGRKSQFTNWGRPPLLGNSRKKTLSNVQKGPLSPSADARNTKCRSIQKSRNGRRNKNEEVFGGQGQFLIPSLFFNYSQPCFCVSTFEECQQSAALFEG